MKKLYSIKDAENLPIENVWELYRKYVNNSQVDLISSFGFGKDTVEKSEGIYIYTKNGKKLSTGSLQKLTNLIENHSISELIDNCLANNKKCGNVA